MKIVTLVALWAVSSACSKTQPEPSPSPAPSPTTPSDGIELVAPGAPPLRPLRYHLTKGAKTPLELAMDLDLQMGPQGGAMPTVVMQMEIRADDVLPDGNARIRSQVTAASARERPDTVMTTETMNAQAMLLTGMEMTATLTPSGRLMSSKIETTGKDLPPAVAGQLSQLNHSLEQVAMPMPEAPVGVGAKWRNRKTVTQNNVVMATVTTVEITAIDGDRVTFKSASQVTGADQKIEVEGTKVAITQIGGGGTSGGVIDLGRMVMTGTFALDFHFDMSARDPNAPAQDKGKEKMLSAPMRMKLAMRVQPTEPGAPGATQGAQSAP